ncbi:MutS domain V [Phlyctema vagabunda]|uniref:MutS domain V n=1 Tax=Phlyctema vagabunda TaxID=108571 RepID=A0ABR4P478_9HELO
MDLLSGPSRQSTTHSTTTIATSYQYPYGYSDSVSQAPRPSTVRPSTGYRSRAASTIGGGKSQQIICAVSKGRGTSPTVGMAFVNISTGEAVLSQICDTQFYVKTLHKLQVFDPTIILLIPSQEPFGTKSQMEEVIRENIIGAQITSVDRRYWSEKTGIDYINQLAFEDEVRAITFAVEGNYFATCCLSAAIKYLEHNMNLSFALHSLRIKFQPSEGCMMIDLSTIQSLELIQNLHNPKSKECLFGLMNQTLTRMGSRLLRSSIVQPSTQKEVLQKRYSSLEELTMKCEMFISVRRALKPIDDVEKLLTELILIPRVPDIYYAEQSINRILMLKSFLKQVPDVYAALLDAGANLLVEIREYCHPDNVNPTLGSINGVINEDVKYESRPLDLRNQRTYAVKSGVNGLLDVARQIFKEATDDVHEHVASLSQQLEVQIQLKFEPGRRYYIRIHENEFTGKSIPDVLVKIFPRKGYFECMTIGLMKLNQRIEDSHLEVVLQSDKTIKILLDEVRADVATLFKVCQGIAMLDMIAGFCQLATDSSDYSRPDIDEVLHIQAGRHPIKEKFQVERYVPNNVFASYGTRFQIITGCNMSGKSTYIRTVALMTVMAQVGSFVPATTASFPIVKQLFARVSTDDSIEANVSTFASEMRETAFILRNMDKHSIIIIDELGRGTSTRDGLPIAISIAEALIKSKAMVWFVTHFQELGHILSNRPGVVSRHLDVDMSDEDKMIMLYRLRDGVAKEQHYGLALARVVGLPSQMLEIAVEVSQRIEENTAAKKASSKTLLVAKRRKLVLALKSTLEAARDGSMDKKALVEWLRKVQLEFVHRMAAIDRDMVSEDQDEAMTEAGDSWIGRESN